MPVEDEKGEYRVCVLKGQSEVRLTDGALRWRERSSAERTENVTALQILRFCVDLPADETVQKILIHREDTRSRSISAHW